MIFNKYSGTEIEIKGKLFLIMTENEVIGLKEP
ncbi:MAG: hypothetical protein ACKOA8_14890 [Deltaproteobacteria bacterium]